MYIYYIYICMNVCMYTRMCVRVCGVCVCVCVCERERERERERECCVCEYTVVKEERGVVCQCVHVYGVRL